MEYDASQRQSRTVATVRDHASPPAYCVGAGPGTFKSAREGCSEAVEPVPGAADAMLSREKL